ncbi:MAG: hypothetical protein OK454_09785 [Thaumarchaeota archaeon]|nr:hypothetical protein [Nitrososphaerota archaeon]
MGRKAKGLDGKEREWRPNERHWLYMRGFKDGAGVRAIRPDHRDISDYMAGYKAGYLARVKAATAHAKKVGYKPTILRLAKKDR